MFVYVITKLSFSLEHSSKVQSRVEMIYIANPLLPSYLVFLFLFGCWEGQGKVKREVKTLQNCNGCFLGTQTVYTS